MEFYSSITNHYDHIFPLNPMQVNMVRANFADGSKLLDVGCATGNLAFELAKHGFDMQAFDLDDEMIELAKNKDSASVVDFKTGDMLQLDKLYNQKFGGIICFGNTLVHLIEIAKIEKFASLAFQKLKANGKLMLQILNYEFILNENITELPLIENDHVRFERYYEFLSGGLVNFKTKLTIKAEERNLTNEVELLPLTKTQLIEILSASGFPKIEVFSSFGQANFNPTSLPLVVIASK